MNYSVLRELVPFRPLAYDCPGCGLEVTASGGVAEWTMATVLKTANPQGFVGSNPTPSAMLCHLCGPRRHFGQGPSSKFLKDSLL